MHTYFAKNLLYSRERKELSQVEMAATLSLGRSTYANYENARTEPNFKILSDIVLKLDINSDNLLFSDLSKGEVIKNEKRANYLSKGEVKGEVRGEVLHENEEIYQVKGRDNALIIALQNSLRDKDNLIHAKDQIIATKDALINHLNAEITALKADLKEAQKIYAKLKLPARK